jgi:uncharacterized membrane protein YcaP (DUF421 family)
VEIVVRAAVMYVVLLCLLRGMGRRELSQLTTFDLLVTVVIGDLIQQGVTQEDMSFTGALLSVGTIALLAVGTSVLGNRSSRAERVLEGVPVVVGRKGVLYDEVLRRERITEAELLEAARGSQVTDLAEIDLIVIEADGQFSFLRADSDSGGDGGDRADSARKRRAT